MNKTLEETWKKNSPQVKEFMESERFQYTKRNHTSEDVVPLKNSIPIEYPSAIVADKLYKMLRECHKNGTFVHTYGALDPVQVINLSKYLKTVYVSGWQCSSTASSTNIPGPDFADYPANTVPLKVDQLFKAQLYHDQRQSQERSTMTAEEREKNPAYDYLAPMIADADSGFGGSTSVMKLTRMFIEAGASGVHLEDQRAGAKKCGHMSGKVLTSSREHVGKLAAIRLQADVMNSPLVIVGRTDSFSARLIDNNVDPVDAPFILGIWDTNQPEDWKTFPEAGELAIKKKFGDSTPETELKLEAWKKGTQVSTLAEAKELAKSLDFDFYFDWDSIKTYEGFYQLRGQNPDYVIQRARHYADYVDLIWVETDTPNLEVAKKFSDGIKKTHPNAMLAYNLSPSFNWDGFNMSDEDMKQFCVGLGKLGYVFQFITLAGFHMDALISEKFSKAFSEDNMLAYVKHIQREERANNVDQLKHQKWSGSQLADKFMSLSTVNSSVLAAGALSTENQFDEKK